MTEETKKDIETTVVPKTAEATENTAVLDDTATIVTPPAGIILDGDKKQLVLTNPAPSAWGRRRGRSGNALFGI